MSDTTPQYLRRSPSLPLPAEWREIRLVSALADYPAARYRAKQLEVDPGRMSSPFAQQLVRELLDELPISGWVAESLHKREGDCPSWSGALKVCAKLDDGTRTELGALAAVGEFVADLHHQSLAEQFRAMAERVEHDEYSPKDRDELDAVQDLAGVPKRGAA